MAPSNKAAPPDKPRAKIWRKSGFVQTGSLVSANIRSVSEKRGFAETRLLTNWREIAGEDIAAKAQPVKVSYAREGFGATLVLLCEGAFGPEVEMQAPLIRERVNACYGYNAISRVRITQTSAHGFADAARPFEPAPRRAPTVSPKTAERAAATVKAVESEALRTALQMLGEHVLSRSGNQTQKS